MFRSKKLWTVVAILLISGLLLSACKAVEPIVGPLNSDVDVTALPLSESNAIHYDDLDALEIDTTAVTAAVWSPDGSLVAVGYEDGSVSIFNAEDGELLDEFADSSVAVASIVWSGDGTEVILTDADGEVSVYAVAP